VRLQKSGRSLPAAARYLGPEFAIRSNTSARHGSKPKDLLRAPNLMRETRRI
jgi:hypothetical protein